MNRTSKAILVATLLSTAASATAQTPAERFAEQYKAWQAYSSGSIVWQQRATATPSTASESPVASRQQLPFEYFQALSTDSAVFKFAPDAGQPADVTAPHGALVAGEPAAPTARFAKGTGSR